LVVADSGCGVADQLGLAKPTASLKDVKFTSATLQAATLAFDLEVDNPYSTDLPLSDLDYSLASSGQKLLSGAVELAGSIPANSSKVLSIPVDVDFLEFIKGLGNIDPGKDIPYEAVLGLAVKTPLGGALRLPIKREGTLSIPKVSLESFLDDIE